MRGERCTATSRRDIDTSHCRVVCGKINLATALRARSQEEGQDQAQEAQGRKGMSMSITIRCFGKRKGGLACLIK